MNEDFFDRLDKYMNFIGLNDNKITVQAGLPVGALGKQRRGGRGLSVQSIAKILHTYPDINAEWLITGDGEMIKGGENTLSEPQSSYIGTCAECKQKDQRIADLLETITVQKELIAELKNQKG
jgi:hypothetical protein